MEENPVIKTISQAHHLLGLSKPLHSLVSVFSVQEMGLDTKLLNQQYRMDLYFILCTDGLMNLLGYGNSTYDFKEGVLAFIGPEQLIRFQDENLPSDAEGWVLLFDPILILGSKLEKMMDQYSFFSYEVDEALHVTKDEKDNLSELVFEIDMEYNQPFDKLSQKLIITKIELLLGYCSRYYDRQFSSRSTLNKELVSKFETILKEYFESEKPQEMGIPSVRYCGQALNFSPNYLSDLLKKETGKNAQEYIHFILIERAKIILLKSKESISEIAYDLGFTYPQHFSKMFKSKTGMSPVQFRNQ